jgi:hypothetical protein
MVIKHIESKKMLGNILHQKLYKFHWLVEKSINIPIKATASAIMLIVF